MKNRSRMTGPPKRKMRPDNRQEQTYCRWVSSRSIGDGFLNGEKMAVEEINDL